MVKTTQYGIKKHTQDMTQFSLFMGGLNAKNEALKAYDPLKTGYARLFITRLPVFMDAIMPTQGKKFKHLLEYGFTGVDGIQNLSMDTEQITGGYAANSFDIGTQAKDETNEITVKLYEFAGSPVREYLDTWMTGISDPRTGLGHYHGCVYKNDYANIIGQDPANVTPLKYTQANHTMEAVYVVTDPTGASTGIEFACLLTNMMPKTVKKDHFNYTSGQHSIVEMDVPFTAVKYESSSVNALAKRLIQRFGVLRDYLDFQSGYDNTKDGLSKDSSIAASSSISDWVENGNITPETES